MGKGPGGAGVGESLEDEDFSKYLSKRPDLIDGQQQSSDPEVSIVGSVSFMSSTPKSKDSGLGLSDSVIDSTAIGPGKESLSMVDRKKAFGKEGKSVSFGNPEIIGPSPKQKHVDQMNQVIREKSCEKFCAKETVILMELEKVFETMTLVDKRELESLREKGREFDLQEKELARLRSVIERGKGEVAEALSDKGV